MSFWEIIKLRMAWETGEAIMAFSGLIVILAVACLWVFAVAAWETIKAKRGGE